MDQIKQVIAVASGKGGVGKSTTTTNLALALQQLGQRVGILDADIYGPNIPHMLGIRGKHDIELQQGQYLTPVEAHGIQTMSIAYLIDPDTPMIWRGPMVSNALKQLCFQTQWGELDTLLIDLPPGTGDIQLTMVQKIPLTGALIVTTPQDIALLDAQKAVQMFRKVEVPILGVVENMSTHTCSACGHTEAIFGEAGADRMAQAYEIKLLGRLPLAMAIRQAADDGAPVVLQEATAVREAYLNIAKELL